VSAQDNIFPDMEEMKRIMDAFESGQLSEEDALEELLPYLKESIAEVDDHSRFAIYAGDGDIVFDFAPQMTILLQSVAFDLVGSGTNDPREGIEAPAVVSDDPLDRWEQELAESALNEVATKVIDEQTEKATLILGQLNLNQVNHLSREDALVLLGFFNRLYVLARRYNGHITEESVGHPQSPLGLLGISDEEETVSVEDWDLASAILATFVGMLSDALF
jgi:hypothetical protein